MDPITIFLAAAIMLVLAIAMVWVLGWANRAFHVDVDPRIDQINAALPAANCGGCGYVGCNDYAEAIVNNGADCDLCPVGGADCAEAVAKIMGVEIDDSLPFRPTVHCGATKDQRKGRMNYQGEQTCAAANLVNGIQGCVYGCLGFGDCVKACNYDAIEIVNGLATINYDKCIGCGACARVCPRNIISMTPFKKKNMLVITCSNKDFGKEVKEVCEVGCIGCKACARNAGSLFKIENNLPVIDYDNYDPNNMEAAMLAVTKCPMKRILDIGQPDPEDQAEVADKEVPIIVEADFKTTVDDSDWRG